MDTQWWQRSILHAEIIVAVLIIPLGGYKEARNTECVGYEEGMDGIWTASPFPNERIVNILIVISYRS